MRPSTLPQRCIRIRRGFANQRLQMLAAPGPADGEFLPYIFGACQVASNPPIMRAQFARVAARVPGRLPGRTPLCPECEGTGRVTPIRREQLLTKETAHRPTAMTSITSVTPEPRRVQLRHRIRYAAGDFFPPSPLPKIDNHGYHLTNGLRAAIGGEG